VKQAKGYTFVAHVVDRKQAVQDRVVVERERVGYPPFGGQVYKEDEQS
jgi:hypothetical protein